MCLCSPSVLPTARASPGRAALDPAASRFLSAAGRFWHPGGDVRELRALLPPDAAGAVQKRCGSRLPASILQPREQVQSPCMVVLRGEGPSQSPLPVTLGKKFKKWGLRCWLCSRCAGALRQCGFWEPWLHAGAQSCPPLPPELAAKPRALRMAV